LLNLVLKQDCVGLPMQKLLHKPLICSMPQFIINDFASFINWRNFSSPFL
jgi:hypothetical protein